MRLKCPSFAWYGLIVVSVLSMAWGGPLFGILTGTTPIMKAAWRLQFTAVLMIPGFIFEWRRADLGLRLRWRQNLWLTVGNGINLALHFSSFSWSVNHTSFAHAMILASSAPVFLALWALALYGIFNVLQRSTGASRAADLGELVAEISTGRKVLSPQSVPSSSDEAADDWSNGGISDPHSGLAATDSVQKRFEYIYADPSAVPRAVAATKSVAGAAAPNTGAGRRSRGQSLGGANVAESGEAIGRRTSSHFVEEPSGGTVLTCELESPVPRDAEGPPSAAPQQSRPQPAPPSTAAERSLTALLRMFGSKAPLPALPSAAAPADASNVSAASVTKSDGASAPSSMAQIVRDRLVIPKPTATELLGALVAFGGMVILVLLTQREQLATAAAAAAAAAAAEAAQQVNASIPASGSGAPASTADAPTIRPFSVEGDVAAAAAAVLMGANLLVGGRLRAWMPLWLYSLPTFIAAAACASFLSLIAEDRTSFFSTGPLGIFGWLGTARRFGLSFLMAFVPTICGHTVSNFALSRVSPLVLSVMLLLAPPISSLYGYALGLQGPPGAGLLLGGPVIIIGIGVTVLGSHKSPLWAILARARARRQAVAVGGGDRGSGVAATAAVVAAAPPPSR